MNRIPTAVLFRQWASSALAYNYQYPERTRMRWQV